MSHSTSNSQTFCQAIKSIVSDTFQRDFSLTTSRYFHGFTRISKQDLSTLNMKSKKRKQSQNFNGCQQKKQVKVYHLSHVDSARKHPCPREVQLGSVKRYTIGHATLFQTQLSMIYITMKQSLLVKHVIIISHKLLDGFSMTVHHSMF